MSGGLEGIEGFAPINLHLVWKYIFVSFNCNRDEIINAPISATTFKGKKITSTKFSY